MAIKFAPGVMFLKNKEIDCFIIGNNQMIFSEYVNNIKKMGEMSGAFRDLNLSYYEEEDGFIYSCSDFFNRYYLVGDKKAEMSYDNIFSATITYLGTFLNRNEISFDYVNSFQEGKSDLLRALKEKRIKTIAITTTYYVSVLPILEIIQFIKKYDETIKIIIGGPFVHTQYEIHNQASFRFLLNQMGADFYVISAQGEQTLVNIINAVKQGQSYETIKNLIYKKGNRYCFNPLAEENNKLSENLVDWELFKEDINENTRRMVMVRTVNSCPFSCAFCSFPAHAGAYQYVEPEDLCKELDQLNQLDNVNRVTFIDDTFNVPIGRFKKILDVFYKKKYRFKWNCNFRCENADEETVALMQACGCEGVFLGLESGSDVILKNMNKTSGVEANKKGIALLKKYNLTTYASFIIGFPGETEETIKETIDFIETAPTDFFRAQLWYYDTMTPIHKQAQKYGLINSQFEWSHHTMNSKEAAGWVDYLHQNIKNSVWLPQNDFDFPGIFNLRSRGWSVKQIKEMLRVFNEKVYSKLYFKQNSRESIYIDPQMVLDTDFDF